jgi:iron complex transport system substrate-binding protein
MQSRLTATTGAHRVFVYDCCDPPFTAARGSVLTDLIRRAGGRNVFDDVDADWTHVSWESVVARRAELVVIHSYAQEGDLDGKLRRLRSIPGMREVPVIVMPLRESLGGLGSFDGLDRLRAAIAGDAG